MLKNSKKQILELKTQGIEAYAFALTLVLEDIPNLINRIKDRLGIKNIHWNAFHDIERKYLRNPY